MLADILKLHGIQSNEQKVLCYLMEHGSTLASIIARSTKLKRPNVYAILNSLYALGLIKKEHREKAIYFSALSPQQIILVLEQRAQQEYEEKKRSAHQLENEFKSITSSIHQDFGGFTIESIDSLEGIYNWLNESLMSGNFVAIFNPQAIQESQISIVKSFLKKSALTQPHIREIMVAGPMANWYNANVKNPNHFTKTMPAQTKIFSDMIITEGTVFILNYFDKNQVGIKIQEPDFYQSMSTLFETLWEKL